MKCPNCGETLKASSKICYRCGEDISDKEVDHIINELIKEDTEGSITTEEKKSKKQDDIYIGISTRITVYVNVLIILLTVISLWLPWFGFSGHAAYLGFVDGQDNMSYLSQEGLAYEGNMDINATPKSNPVLYEFSAKDLRDYSKKNSVEYEKVTTTGGEQKTSWVVRVQSYYIKGIFLITVFGAFSVLILLMDRKLKVTEWVRTFSAISALIIIFNFIAVKIPFFSMFANKAQSVLREQNPLVAVNLSLKGINMNQELYAYEVIEKQGFYMAVICCALWFVVSTVLIEIKKDKEFR